eukprot:15457850-Alexandrium_andersonii.AAC.1
MGALQMRRALRRDGAGLKLHVRRADWCSGLLPGKATTMPLAKMGDEERPPSVALPKPLSTAELRS